jgi:Tol biopolymer transport system component
MTKRRAAMKNIGRVSFLIAGIGLGMILLGSPSFSRQTAGELFEKALYMEEGQGDLQKAIGLFQDLLKRFPDNRDIAANAQLHIGLCYEKLGLQEAERAFQKVIDNYPEQANAVETARKKIRLLLSFQTKIEKDGAGLNIRSVLAGKPMDWPQISPDGRSLAYFDYGGGAIAVYDLATGQTRLLNTRLEQDETAGESWSFRWSPDGKSIVCGWWKGMNLEWTDLRILSVDGSAPRRLVLGESQEMYVYDWSTDGSRILAARLPSRPSRAFQVVVVSASDGSMRLIKELGQKKPENMCFSPDGRFIVYDYPAERSTADDIFILAADGGKEIPLVANPTNERVLGWTPDGRHVLYASDRTGSWAAWLVPVQDGEAGGEARLVKADIGSMTPVGFSRDGTFYYSTGGVAFDIYAQEIDLEAGKILGPADIAIQRFVGSNVFAAWSHDGADLAYVSRRTPSPAICIRNSKSKQERELFPKLEWIQWLRWAPDGRSLMAVGSDGINRGSAVFVIDASTGAVDPVLFEMVGPVFEWSRDSRSIYFGRNRWAEKSGAIILRNLESRQERTIIALNGDNRFFQDLVLSPDGQMIATRIWDENQKLPLLAVLPAEGGEIRVLMELQGESLASVQGGIAWGPDSKEILFVKQSDGKNDREKRYELWISSVDSGENRKLEEMQRMIGWISLHPDAHRLIFSSGSPRSEIWAMENILPGEPAAQPAIEKGPQTIGIRKVWDKALDSFFMGAPSPDGRFVTYVDWQNFANLGIRDMAKGENRLLTDIKTWDNGEMCDGSIFSPDGGRIAYSFLTKNTLYQLRVVNLDGSKTRILYNGKETSYLIPFGWTPDGKQILAVFYGQDRSAKIAFVSEEDGSVRVLKDMSARFAKGSPRLSLSPDGKLVAFSFVPREDAAAGDIGVISAENGQETMLVEHPADDVLLGWSPDGGRVFFTSDRTGSVGVWSVAVSGGKVAGMPEIVRGDIGNIRALGMTRNGELFYGIHTGWSDIFVAPFDPGTGQVTARPEKAFRKYETFNSAPDWSVDGQFLVCRSSRGKMANETPALLVRSLRTNDVREVNPKISGGLNFHFILWTADGRSVLGVGMDKSGKYGALLSIDIQTGEASVLAGVESDDPIFYPARAADGKSVYFIRSGKELQRLIRLDLESRAETEILRSSEALGSFRFALSPDGRQMAVIEGDKITVGKIDGMELRELARIKGITTMAWTKDGKNILSLKPRDGSDDVVDLWTIPANGGQSRKAGLSLSRLMHLRVSPDGRNIAFTASEQPGRSELWVMENFLPAGKK